jgi:PadR family transcriptional regulator, regulatory protein AphA
MPSELSTSAYVLMGMLSQSPMSGYDIKQFADVSTRHFWAISYGQIYPELRNLVELGLIDAQSAPSGSRQRTLYSLTPLGREELVDWLSITQLRAVEVRDEMLLRLFFADILDLEKRVELLRAMVRRHLDTLRNLEVHEPVAAAGGPSLQLETLRFGIAFHRFCADHFNDLIKAAEAIPVPAKENARC